MRVSRVGVPAPRCLQPQPNPAGAAAAAAAACLLACLLAAAALRRRRRCSPPTPPPKAWTQHCAGSKKKRKKGGGCWSQATNVVTRDSRSTTGPWAPKSQTDFLLSPLLVPSPLPKMGAAGNPCRIPLGAHTRAERTACTGQYVAFDNKIAILMASVLCYGD